MADHREAAGTRAHPLQAMRNGALGAVSLPGGLPTGAGPSGHVQQQLLLLHPVAGRVAAEHRHASAVHGGQGVVVLAQREVVGVLRSIRRVHMAVPAAEAAHQRLARLVPAPLRHFDHAAHAERHCLGQVGLLPAPAGHSEALDAAPGGAGRHLEALQDAGGQRSRHLVAELLSGRHSTGDSTRATRRKCHFAAAACGGLLSSCV
mmetsp:Transcript_19195/g.72533  ORF Transcript_19195/g.72533 Transcript_19195/m.72533 type:complete len:205 (-) Transcript_19195:140-754(-)